MKPFDAHREVRWRNSSFADLLFNFGIFTRAKSLGMVLDLGGQLLSKKLFTALCFFPAATPLLAPPFLPANSLPVC
jgi:hypothetical protein